MDCAAIGGALVARVVLTRLKSKAASLPPHSKLL